ncbi:universal stress protein [Thiomonas sp. FB-6]|uniref:universal stress protein n=1 Tax=Thiomonas sp. FB-6 TaxID=1158291 RepID=UPI0003792F48|nr:universal stress protein [Thiomonas sp. FB-6]
MNPDNKVLACVDRSHFADFVADYAAWAACRMHAPLEFLHVIDRHPEIGSGKDHSGAIGIDAQETLLKQITEEEQIRTKAERERGREFLNRLRERALAAGAEAVDMRQRHGGLVDTLVEQEQGVRLVVLGRRGASAESSGRDIGRNVERVTRSLHTPVLTVTEGFKPPRRVLIAYDGSAVTRRGVELVASSPVFSGLQVHLLMCGKAGADADRKLQQARAGLEAHGMNVVASFLPGDLEAGIVRTVRDAGIDLLIMGAYSHSPLRSLLLGSKTTDLLRASTIPTLLLR